jgi:hypothetical protein
VANGAVIINEIAWMGSSVSANHEWIELYNDGSSSQSLEDWTLSDGMNLSIALTGQLSPGAYAVLERTSDESAPSNAFLVYAGALVNTGATLTLYNNSGQIMDAVSGGEDWSSIGGDNVTKETAQYTSSGWVTDTPTPGRVNGAGRVVLPDDDEDEDDDESASTQTNTKKSVTQGSSNKTVPLVQSTAELSLTVDAQTIAYVHQEVAFEAVPKGIGDTITHSLVYTWNFGDSYSAVGKTATHRYSYPGTYVVTANAVYGRHDVVVRHEVTVLPVTVTLSRSVNGDIQLHNNAQYDIDVSGYILKGTAAVRLPAHSIMLPRSTMTIARSRLETGDPESSHIALFDDTTTLVASTMPTATAVATRVSNNRAEVALESSPRAVAVTPAIAPATARTFTFATAAEENVTLPALATATTAASSTATNTAATTSPLPPEEVLTTTSAKSSTWPYWLLIALVGAVLLTLKKRPTEA